VDPDQMVLRVNRRVEMGEEPIQLNGRRGPRMNAIIRSCREGIVRSFEQSKTHLLQTRDVQ
jgi:hypothetical protein